MKTWKIWLKDGTALSAQNWHHLRYGDSGIVVSEIVTVAEKDKVTGWGWWRKVVKGGLTTERKQAALFNWAVFSHAESWWYGSDEGR
jgi:hypothetical protein